MPVSRLFLLISITVVLGASALAAQTRGFRTWTNRADGRTMEARVSAFNAHVVELISPQGQKATFQRAVFTDEDNTYLDQLPEMRFEAPWVDLQARTKRRKRSTNFIYTTSGGSYDRQVISSLQVEGKLNNRSKRPVDVRLEFVAVGVPEGSPIDLNHPGDFRILAGGIQEMTLEPGEFHDFTSNTFQQESNDTYFRFFSGGDVRFTSGYRTAGWITAVWWYDELIAIEYSDISLEIIQLIPPPPRQEEGPLEEQAQIEGAPVIPEQSQAGTPGRPVALPNVGPPIELP